MSERIRFTPEQRREYAERNERMLHSFETTSQRSGDVWRVVCPFCVSSKTGRPDMSARVKLNGRWTCYRCSEYGRLKGFDFDESTSCTWGALPKEQVEIQPPEGWHPLWTGEGATALSFEPARQYLRKRGVSGDMLEVLQVGAVLNGYYGGRVVLPLLDGADLWRGWVARDWTGTADRPYLNAKSMSREFLWNGHVLDIETDEPAIIVEGIFDAVSLWPNACAVLGKPTHQHVDLMLGARRPVVLCLDGDAIDEEWELLAKLRLYGVRSGAIRLPAKVDPDEAVDYVRARARVCLEELL